MITAAKTVSIEKLVEGLRQLPVLAGQRLHLTARALGRRWPVIIDIEALDPGRRWIDMRVGLPLGVVNHEHVTLTQTEGGGTLVRFN